MIVLSWNIRGLGARIKRSALRKLIASHQPRFVFIQESKKETINPKFIASIWKNSDVNWCASPSNGNSGGLLSMWDSTSFSMQSTLTGRNWIALIGLFPDSDFKCFLLNIYNPCLAHERELVWDEITKLWESLKLPCLIIGDFNEVLSPLDRGSQSYDPNNSNMFQSFVQDLQLIEIPLSNGWFTWHRGASKSKLDRLFVNNEWIAQFPSLSLSSLKRTLSDHCPLLARSSVKNWGPRPFRFQNCWLSHPGCIKAIRIAWNQSNHVSLIDKLQAVKNALKLWNSKEFGNIDEEISICEN